MNKYLKLAILTILILPIYVYAHPGGTDSSGCHTCKTNCSNWGLSYGEYHCHANKGSSQPEYPVSSTYGSSGTGYTTPNPSYAYPSSYSSSLDCPLNSYSDGTSCKCNYGYSVSGDKCVNDDQICQNQLGYNSSYDSLTDKCKCRYGYVIGSSGQCVSGSSYCSDKIGLMSTYDSLSRTCDCMSGYEFDGYQCSYKKKTYSSYEDKSTDYESNTCPTNSSISLSDSTKCSCNVGYITNSTKDGCVLEPVKVKEINTNTSNTKTIINKESVPVKIKKAVDVKTNEKISTSTPSFDQILKGNQNLSVSTTTTNNQAKKISWFTKFINLFR